MPTVAGKKYAYTAKGKAAAKAAKKKKKKVSDQSKQSAKRVKRKGRKAPGRPLSASEEAYFQGKRYA
tara:strand:- start:287 stop:487 length:201 start_codon:yes stop_codon:yes gene_type:complete